MQQLQIFLPTHERGVAAGVNCEKTGRIWHLRFTQWSCQGCETLFWGEGCQTFGKILVPSSSKARHCKTTWPLKLKTPCSLKMKLKTPCSLKMLVTTHPTAQHYIPEDFKPLSRGHVHCGAARMVCHMICIMSWQLCKVTSKHGWHAVQGGVKRCMKNLNKARSFKQNSENLWALIAQSV